eukprot:403342099
MTSPSKKILSQSFPVQQETRVKINSNEETLEMIEALSQKDKFGNTILHTAAMITDQTIVEILIQSTPLSKLDLNSTNLKGHMPFQQAIFYDNYDIAANMIPLQYQKDHPSFYMQIQQKQKNSGNQDDRELKFKKRTDLFERDSNQSNWNSIDQEIQDEELQQLKSNDWDQPIKIRNLNPKEMNLNNTNRFKPHQTPINPNEISELDQVVVQMLAKDGNFDRKSVVEKYSKFKNAVIYHQNISNVLSEGVCASRLDMTAENVMSFQNSPTNNKNSKQMRKEQSKEVSLMGAASKSFYNLSMNNDVNYEQTVDKILQNRNYMENKTPDNKFILKV